MKIYEKVNSRKQSIIYMEQDLFDSLFDATFHTSHFRSNFCNIYQVVYFKNEENYQGKLYYVSIKYICIHT